MTAQDVKPDGFLLIFDSGDGINMTLKRLPELFLSPSEITQLRGRLRHWDPDRHRIGDEIASEIEAMETSVKLLAYERRDLAGWIRLKWGTPE